MNILMKNIGHIDKVFLDEWNNKRQEYTSSGKLDTYCTLRLTLDVKNISMKLEITTIIGV